MCFARMFPINDNSHLSITEEGTNPGVKLSLYSICVQLEEEAIVWHRVKRLGEIQYQDVCLVVLVKVLHQVVDGKDKLCLARISTPESMVQGRKNAVALEVVMEI